MNERVIEELSKHVDQLKSRDIGRIVFEVEDDTKLKIFELYGDRLEERDWEKVTKSMSEEKRSQAVSERWEREDKELDKREELIEGILKSEGIIEELGKHVDQLKSRDIGRIAFEVEDDTKLKIFELYGDRLEEQDWEKVTKSMMEEKRSQAVSERWEREDKEWDRREELIESILMANNKIKTNAIDICKRAEQYSSAIEQEQALSAMVKGMERDNQQERGDNSKSDPRD